MKNYIEEFLNDEILSIELLKSSLNKNESGKKSFKVVTTYKHLECMYDMNNWPSGVFVRKLRRINVSKKENVESNSKSEHEKKS